MPLELRLKTSTCGEILIIASTRTAQSTVFPEQTVKTLICSAVLYQKAVTCDFYNIHTQYIQTHTCTNIEPDTQTHSRTYTQALYNAAVLTTIIIDIKSFCRDISWNIKRLCGVSMGTKLDTVSVVLTSLSFKSRKLIDTHVKSFQKVPTLIARIWKLADISLPKLIAE